MSQSLIPILTGLLTLAGVCVTAWAGARQTRDALSNQLTTAQAVTDCKLEQLTAEVRRHNDFARRLPVVEQQILDLSRRMEEVEK
ncbi:MAG: hypothetical protein IKH07_05760 [Oscillospiraceae bacterium]|nr:hypothetical protein [Oscillospiraceae bacterium]